MAERPIFLLLDRAMCGQLERERDQRDAVEDGDAGNRTRIEEAVGIKAELPRETLRPQGAGS